MTQHKMGLWKFVALSRQPINIVNNLVILIAAGSKISSQQTKIDGVKQILTDIKEKESSKKVRKCVITKESFWLIRKTRLGVDKVKPKGWFKFFLTDK